MEVGDTGQVGEVGRTRMGAESRLPARVRPLLLLQHQNLWRQSLDQHQNVRVESLLGPELNPRWEGPAV